MLKVKRNSLRYHCSCSIRELCSRLSCLLAPFPFPPLTFRERSVMGATRRGECSPFLCLLRQPRRRRIFRSLVRRQFCLIGWDEDTQYSLEIGVVECLATGASQCRRGDLYMFATASPTVVWFARSASVGLLSCISFVASSEGKAS